MELQQNGAAPIIPPWPTTRSGDCASGRANYSWALLFAAGAGRQVAQLELILDEGGKCARFCARAATCREGRPQVEGGKRPVSHRLSDPAAVKVRLEHPF